MLCTHELERRTEELAALREKAGAAAHAADTARSSARTAEAQKMSARAECCGCSHVSGVFSDVHTCCQWASLQAPRPLDTELQSIKRL